MPFNRFWANRGDKNHLGVYIRFLFVVSDEFPCAMAKLKATGHRGSWYADVGDEQLPCVHKHWVNASAYDDPGAKPGDPKWEEFVNAIRLKKKVILTDSDLHNDGTFVRKSYIAVFGADEVEFDDKGLRFKLTNRLTELE